ncbi:MAG: sodium:solute symporter [Prevotella sp.]|nr:sodium:solute symporter [Prevotella sp.]
MSIIDLVIFFIFTGGIVLLGASFYSRRTTADDFISAGRSLPGWVVGMSIFSTYVSSISYLGYPGKAYDADWNAFVFSLSIPIASWVAARWFVPFYRKQASVSAYAFLEERFGLWARWYASACYLLTQVARIGTIVYLLALPMNLLLGWDIRVVIIMTSLAIILYSMLGGVKGVIWADAIQGFIMIGGALVCLAILWWSFPGGPVESVRVAWEAGKFSLGSFSLTTLGESTFWVCLVYGIFTNLQNYGIDQNYVQRYHAAKTDREARFSALFGGYLFIPVSAVFFLIGTALWSYYHSQFAIGELPFTKGDQVFPYFIVHVLPTGLTGLLVASIFAAGMSTVSTSITSGATVVLSDFFERLTTQSLPAGNGSGRSREDKMSGRQDECAASSRALGERQEEGTARPSRAALLVLRLSSLVIGLLGILISLALVNVDSILDSWWKLSSVFSGGMLGLFLLGFLSQKARHVDAAIGVICGVLVIAWISLGDSGIHEYLAIVFGTIVIFLVGFVLAKAANRVAS